MRKAAILLTLLVAVASCAGLAGRIRGRLERAGGRWGVYIHDLRSGRRIALNADARFHPASTRKILVLLKVLRDVAAGRLRMSDTAPVVDTFPSVKPGAPRFRVQPGTDAVRRAVGRKLSLRELARWMIEKSDNLATNVLIASAGGPEAITRFARLIGMKQSSVRSFVMDVAAHRAGLRSVGVPREYGQLMELLWRKKAISPEVSAQAIAFLRMPSRGAIGGRLPATARIAHKPGRIVGVLTDAALITSARGHAYAFVIMADGLRDIAAGKNTIADVSAMVFEAFDPSR